MLGLRRGGHGDTPVASQRGQLCSAAIPTMSLERFLRRAPAVKYVKAAELATSSVTATSSMGSCAMGRVLGRDVGKATGSAMGNAPGSTTGSAEDLCWYVPTLKISPCTDTQMDVRISQAPLFPDLAQGCPGWHYLEGNVSKLLCEGWRSQQGVVDGGKGVQLGGHCRDMGVVSRSQTTSPLPQPGCQDVTPQWGPANPAGHQSCPQPPRTTLPVRSPGVPSPTFHVLQGSVQPVNAPLEHEAELKARAGVSESRDEGLQASHWAGGNRDTDTPGHRGQAPTCLFSCCRRVLWSRGASRL